MAKKTKSNHLIPTGEFSENGKGILFFDDLFEEQFNDDMALYLAGLDYTMRPSFDKEFSFSLTKNHFKKFSSMPALFGEIINLYKSKLSPNPASQRVSHLYAAAIRHGDSTRIHQDVPCTNCITFLYYANVNWKAEWAGETLFYSDNQNESIAAIVPRPGRLVVFNAALYHRAGVPNRQAPSFRYALSVFYRCNKMRISNISSSKKKGRKKSSL
jgi:Rps23 Pro-64 3,4-dihydroxylase Tpa1-like proline 4-hydroxylase